MLLDMGHDESAAVLLEATASEGHSKSQYQLGLMYEHGVGVDRDMRKAFEWLELAMLQGDPTAKYVLARYYEEGIIVEKDKRAAIRLRREAESEATIAAEEEDSKVSGNSNAEREERWDSMSYKEMLAEFKGAVKEELQNEMGTLS